MSSYDPTTKAGAPAGPGSEESQVRREAHSSSSASRQQLPSLSSLFGPPSQMPPQPQRSPFSERPSPAFGLGLHSPFDRPHSASGSSERTYSNSYFPNISPSTQPRVVYEPKLDRERPLAPARSLQFPGPLSPPTRDFEPASQGLRNESVSSGRWSQSSRSEPRGSDYALCSQEPTRPFRPISDRPQLPPFGHKLDFETSFGSREQSQIQPSLPTQPQGSSAPASLDGAPVKDGLGPKIWTGTHFLPRFVRQAEVPGEGMCYFYDDGTHCKTVIDGEPVNAHWGVTKAGKPRKRLAIACLTCREKKIKCDPDFPRCVQCEKFGRVCKFKNA
ncbi:hypothetical protein SLS62_008172 [Diatrype stigma]|uniref:Zn(2)-C6 fungal-type domain-containing protein n=1 Tax=Diatrype stigma TaxID=117547 RepID=A0AAN9UKW9_9PEZI